jgi:thiamine-phosphate pyrophosphorylase
MASALSRAKLARAACTLNARYARLPTLILMTDERRLPDPSAAASALPKGSAIILRHTDAKARAGLAENLSRIARARELILLIADDAALAARLDCQGVHLPEAHAREAAHLKALHPSWLVTVAAHSARAVAHARLCRADAVLLAAVFPTASHIGRAALGATRFKLIAQSAGVPVYALGGVNAQNVRALDGSRLAGIAAIEALTPDQSS